MADALLGGKKNPKTFSLPICFLRQEVLFCAWSGTEALLLVECLDGELQTVDLFSLCVSLLCCFSGDLAQCGVLTWSGQTAIISEFRVQRVLGFYDDSCSGVFVFYTGRLPRNEAILTSDYGPGSPLHTFPETMGTWSHKNTIVQLDTDICCVCEWLRQRQPFFPILHRL